VDFLVLTHVHIDHVGGIVGVVDGRGVGEVLESPPRDPPEGVHLVDSTLRAGRGGRARLDRHG
jgi:competence protein ComEC